MLPKALKSDKFEFLQGIALATLLVYAVMIAVQWASEFQHSSNIVVIKYRDNPVDISASNFEPLNKTDQAIGGAWYDAAEQYMVIKLGDTYYHYCGMPSDVWRDLRITNDLYEQYQDRVRGNFDCRIYHVPSY